MCWGAGILLSSGVVRAVTVIEGDMAWRLPFMLQWVWPVPLFLAGYFCPESPWNAVRRGQIDIARKSLTRLRQGSEDLEGEVEASLAYIRHTTALEEAESESASFLECFQGTNLRRTEIVSAYPWHTPAITMTILVPLLTFILELRRLGSSDPLRQRHSRLLRRFPPVCRLL